MSRSWRVVAILFAGLSGRLEGAISQPATEQFFPVTLGVDWHGGSASTSFTVVARPLLTESGATATNNVRAVGPSLVLSRGAWSLSIERQGYWAPSEVIVVQGSGVSATLSAWPTGVVRGRFTRRLDDADPIRDLVLAFAPAPGEREGPSGVVTCLVDGLQWSCDVPAAKLALQVNVPGHATRYEWDRTIAAGQILDLGAAELHRGGSVVGWIEDAQGHPVAADLVVATSGSEAVTGRAGSVLKSGRAGFFQVAGLGSGTFILHVSKQAMAPASVAFRVEANRETRLNEPVVVTAPVSVALTVAPPLDPDGQRWNFEVVAIREGAPQPIASGELGHDGRWRRSDLAGGRYYFSVSSGSKQQWWGQEVELEPGRPEEVVVQIPVVTVRGSVSLGGSPLSGATVTFGGTLGHVHLSARSDPSGVFALRLPRPGRWAVDVEADVPRIHRSVAVEVEVTESEEGRAVIVLTDGRVKGYVRDEAGSPLAAQVRAIPDGGADSVVAGESGPDGAFELRGLPTGPATLAAIASGGLLSEPAAIAIDGDSEGPPIELVVRRSKVVQGIVFSGDGGVEGARISAFPLPLGNTVVPVATDAEGRFEVRVPAGSTELVISVSAVGFAFKILRRELLSEDPILIPMERGDGTLRVILPNETDAVMSTFIVHDGGFAGLMALRRWAIMNGKGAQLGREVSIPSMPPGPYTACLGGRTSLTAALSVPTQPANCASGYLQDGAELLLKLSP
jgi:hypothetical protein